MSTGELRLLCSVTRGCCKRKKTSVVYDFYVSCWGLLLFLRSADERAKDVAKTGSEDVLLAALQGMVKAKVRFGVVQRSCCLIDLNLATA